MGMSLFLVVGSLLVGQVPIVIPEPDPQEVEANLRVFSSSKHETTEFLDAARFLRQYCSLAILRAFPYVPPDGMTRTVDPEKLTPLVRRVRNALVQRGTNYLSLRPRTRFLDNIDVLMFDQPLEQLSLLRDALNDPHPAVRGMAPAGLRQWIEDATHPDQSHWPLKARKRLMPIEEQLDEIADLLIWKGLTDAENWQASKSVLRDFDGNQRRIRSLRRALSAEIIRDPNAIREAESILESWDPVYAAKKERERKAQKKAEFDAAFGPDAPFGRGDADDPFGRGKKGKNE